MQTKGLINLNLGSNLAENISRLQRRDLETDRLELTNPASYLQEFCLVKVKSIGKPKESAATTYQLLMESVITGLHSKGLPLIFMLVGLDRKISLYLGTKVDAADLLSRTLFATFPGISLGGIRSFQEVNSEVPDMKMWGTMTGIPASPNEEKNTKILQIERLIKGMYGENWAYLVLAHPIDQTNTQQALHQIGKEMTVVSHSLLTKGTLREDNRVAKFYLELLEGSFKKFNLGIHEGMWAVQTYVLTSNQGTLLRALVLLKSIYEGKESSPQPIRTHQCSFVNEENNSLATVLNSNALSTLIQLPREEMPGYGLKSYQKFDVDLKSKPEHPIAVGEVIDNNRGLGYWFEIERDELTSHLLVAGATGSGKTNALMFLLSKLWKEQKIPFLVIEPAKREYRNLLEVEGFGELKIYTLGDERTSPFRLNPFEVQSGSLIQSHIDYLKSVFNASFSMYPPMPYILEESIIKIYEDKGWDLATNINRFGIKQGLFPTLKELSLKIEEVVTAKGYDNRIKTDIIAALKTRVNNLMIGAKGLMLNTQSSMSIAQLLEKPTILELEAIGDDEEKAFIIGLILAKIYEYRKAQRNNNGRLRHITLIEEAHRLLRNVPIDTLQSEVANLRGKAVETFCNILSEIRTYGEGICLAEQIVSKLSPDATKNTLTKLLLRTPSKSEVKAMGDSMNLKEEEEEFVACLETGQALVFSKGMDRPVLVKVPDYKSLYLGKNEVTDGRLRKYLKRGLPFKEEKLDNG